MLRLRRNTIGPEGLLGKVVPCFQLIPKVRGHTSLRILVICEIALCADLWLIYCDAVIKSRVPAAWYLSTTHGRTQKCWRTECVFSRCTNYLSVGRVERLLATTGYQKTESRISKRGKNIHSSAPLTPHSNRRSLKRHRLYL